MKMNYHGYTIERHKDQKHYLMDIRPFLRAFCNFNNAKYKNRFTYAGEHIYLLHQTDNLYLFLMTRSHEIIKKIRSDNLTVTEIYTLLNRQEKLGFVSYLYMDKSYFGFASTIMAPRIKAFVGYINDIFDSLNIHNYRFVSHPMLAESTRKDVISMPFLGRSVIQVTKENSLFEDFREFFSATAQEFQDVDSFEIIFKPRRKQNIKPAIKKVLKNLPDEGIDKFMVRAREELEGQLMDHYLAGKGIVSDVIDNKSEKLIPTAIKEKVRDNKHLKEKVKAHESDKRFKEQNIKAITAFNDARAWTDRIRDL